MEKVEPFRALFTRGSTALKNRQARAQSKSHCNALEKGFPMVIRAPTEHSQYTYICIEVSGTCQ
jgi:hypothetical protein